MVGEASEVDPELDQETMIEVIHEHSLDTSILKQGCTVLDVGCRGFEFGDYLKRRFGALVYSVDIDDLGDERIYNRFGIGAVSGFGDVSTESDPDSRRLVPGNQFRVFTIESFGKYTGVTHWDVIKLDCEGSEYDILMGLNSPPADQITVEFHQHTEAYKPEWFMENLLKHLGQWYDVRQHWISGKKRSLNYWDSLFTLK